MKRTIILLLCSVAAHFSVSAADIEIPELKAGYPRMINVSEVRNKIDRMVATPEGGEAMRGIERRLEPYMALVAENPDWLLSRLQMYWHSHATDIYVDGEQLAYVEGHAPVPTVRYVSNRSGHSDYARPALRDVKPYQDSLGLWMRNRKSGVMEWVDHRKTGSNVESINREIMGLVRDAAFLYWYSGEERYAELAADVFDCYVTGLYWRKIPVDLNHGQQQTLVGLNTFEVIHEDIAVPTAECYDFLHDYLVRTRHEKIATYEEAFKRWADNIIANGVPHNNWNLIQAQFVLRLALVLQDDAAYSDGHGRQYYLNAIFNRSSIRQWSIGRLIDFGFDSRTGLWKESPGYATMVLGEFTSLLRLVDTVLGIDLVEAYPVLALGVENMPQYLFPNGWSVGWGDTHYGPLRSDLYSRLVANAQQYCKRAQEELFTSLDRCFNDSTTDRPQKIAPKVESFTSAAPLTLDSAIPAVRVEDLVTRTFYADELSWFAARTGMDPQKSLMMSVCGSKGNHMHANGISVELYGKGYVQAPDLGRGKGYTTLDYAEFYSQFPAHNTVCVDGVSSYPVMMSQHAYRLEGCYPAVEQREGFYDGVCYGDFSFVEPETQSDQRRQLLIINTDPGNGYYVDIFRSRRRDGRDRMHDYFYHNIGQEFTLDTATEPTEELAFAGGHLYAYSYLWDKSATTTDKDVSGRFTMISKDGTKCGMRMWMRGEKERTVFKALSPHIDAMTRTPMPYDVKNSPCQTFVARQEGEAWTRPFAAVYQPFDDSGDCIANVEWPECGENGTVAVRVEKRDGRTDLILSSDEMRTMEADGVKVCAELAVVSRDEYFMAAATLLECSGVRISAETPATVTLEKRDGKWYYTSTAECRIRIDGKTRRLPAANVCTATK